MPRLGSTGDEIRGLVLAARESWREIDENVLRSGVVDQALKELCFRYLAGDADTTDFARFGARESTALRWADAIAYDSDRADDELWERLHELFTEPELVDLGCAIGFELGQQHWRRTMGMPARAD
jgi:alkylhydroperoxidase family enzyme